MSANFLNGVLEEIDEGILDGKLEGISDDLEVEVDFGSGFRSEWREEFAELAFDIDGRLAWEPASGSFEPAFDGELVVDFAAVNLSEEEGFAAGGGVGVLSEFAGKFFEGVDDASEDENGMGEIHRAADFVDLLAGATDVDFEDAVSASDDGEVIGGVFGDENGITDEAFADHVFMLRTIAPRGFVEIVGGEENSALRSEIEFADDAKGFDGGSDTGFHVAGTAALEKIAFHTGRREREVDGVEVAIEL